MARNAATTVAILAAAGGAAYVAYKVTRPAVDLGLYGAHGFAWQEWSKKVVTIKEGTVAGSAETAQQAAEVARLWYSGAASKTPVGAAGPQSAGGATANGGTGTTPWVDLGSYGAPGGAWSSSDRGVYNIQGGVQVGSAGSALAAATVFRAWAGYAPIPAN
jgi:hypothetical protein